MVMFGELARKAFLETLKKKNTNTLKKVPNLKTGIQPKQCLWADCDPQTKTFQGGSGEGTCTDFR